MLEKAVILSSRDPRRRAVILPLSIALHLVVIAVVVAASVWRVGTPENPPHQLGSYAISTIPAVPPPAPAAKARTSETKTPVRPEEQVAPTVVPDVPAEPLETVGSSGGTVEGVPEGVEGGDPFGRPDGVEGSVAREPIAPPEPPRTYRAGGDVSTPQVTVRVEPVYPELARKIGAKGIVVLECIIDRSGVVRDARVTRSAHPVLDRAALDAVRQWRFTPGMLDGKAVDVIFSLTVTFDLAR